MYTVVIRIYRSVYLVAKHYCRAIDADQWISDWMRDNAILYHWDEYRSEIKEIGKF